MNIDKETLEILSKDKFPKCDEYNININNMIDMLNSEICNKRFNPHVNINNIYEMYDTMDDIQEWKTDLGKIYHEALKYKEMSELIEATINGMYLDAEKKMLIGEELKKAVDDKKFKNIDEKKAWINEQINKEVDINDIINKSNKHLIKASSKLKQIDNIKNVIEGQEDKYSRKISLLHEEIQLGLLKTDDPKGDI
jgi:hypothetical protein